MMKDASGDQLSTRLYDDLNSWGQHVVKDRVPLHAHSPVCPLPVLLGMHVDMRGCEASCCVCMCVCACKNNNRETEASRANAS
jgi:hypothetical protein